MLSVYRDSADSPKSHSRYVLVEREQAKHRERPVPRQSPIVKRYSLARLGTSPRSALGVDRHARLEQVAEQSPPNE